MDFAGTDSPALVVVHGTSQGVRENDACVFPECGRESWMSLQSDFYALPLTYRIIIMIGSMAFAYLCGLLMNMYQGNGVAVAAAGGCGGALLSYIGIRVVASLFLYTAVKSLKPGQEEKAGRQEQTASRRAETLAQTQLARARALMTARDPKETGERQEAGAQAQTPQGGEAPPAPASGGQRGSPNRRTFGRRARRQTR